VRISLNRDECVGTGCCESVAPSIFRVDDDGCAEILEPNPAPELRDRVRDAARLCPMQCISLHGS
jgi:ferredoxin